MTHETINDRLAAVEKTLKEQDDALFGSWDMETRSRKPGLVEQVNFLVFAVRWGIGPLLALCVLLLAGESSKELIPTVAKALLAFVSR